jgi:predicted ester cyclase
MTAEQNKALLQRYIELVWDLQNPDAIDQFLAPHYRRHLSATSPPLTRAEQKQLLTRFRAAFPDIRITVEEVIADGDCLAFRSTMRGTHQGEFQGIAPTGKAITVGLLDLIRIENGKFVEQWGGPNLLDLLQQLGAMISTAPTNE